MVHYVAIKINEDNRERLAPHLRYSVRATDQEYQPYLDRFENKHIGGWGFHECMNFEVGSNGDVKFYLPPKSYPRRAEPGDGVCIFSFTYKPDLQIVGVHGNCELVGREGRIRRDVRNNTKNYNYHGSSHADFVTLFTPSLHYKITGPYCKNFSRGLTYLSSVQASNILSDAAGAAAANLAKSSGASSEQREAASLELEVIRRIVDRYSITAHIPTVKGPDDVVGGNGPSKRMVSPDDELGKIGEEYIYQRELKYASANGFEKKEIEWMRNINLHSPYDVKTLRKYGSVLKRHYLEVKSTVSIPPNIFVTESEERFARSHESSHNFVLLTFKDRTSAPIREEECSLTELKRKFEFIPTVFHLRQK